MTCPFSFAPQGQWHLQKEGGLPSPVLRKPCGSLASSAPNRASSSRLLLDQGRGRLETGALTCTDSFLGCAHAVGHYRPIHPWLPGNCGSDHSCLRTAS